MITIHPGSLYWPAAVTEDQEENTKDDAGESDVDPDDDACRGRFTLIVFDTVTRGVQDWKEKGHKTVRLKCVYFTDTYLSVVHLSLSYHKIE